LKNNANFAARLVARLTPSSCLIHAATRETMSGPDLTRRIQQFAAAFSAAGLSAGDRILIGCELSPASSLAYLGAMYAGLVAVPVEERVLASTGPSLLGATDAKAFWTGGRIPLAWNPPNGAQYLHGDLAAPVSGTFAPVSRAADDLAALMATSGSTGTPRFVKVSHGNLTANTEAIIRSQHLEDNERALLILPVSYCFGASVLHTHLYQGGSAVFDHRFTFPDVVLAALAEYGCTTFAGVPTVYNILLRRSGLGSIALPNLRRFLQAGGGLSPERIKEMRAAVPTAEFFVMYGQTEATARISCLDPAALETKLGSAGRPLDNLALRIVDEQGHDLPTGEVGEILVSGPSICSGYWNDTEESHRVFRDGWLHTRDLGCLDREGYLWIQGRQSAFLKIRGLRVSLAEVEARVLAVSGVNECAATAVPHVEAGEALALFIVPAPGSPVEIEDIRRALRPQWTCISIKLLPELPKTASGKIVKTSLA
jgi:acyl-CoA synthetase (AMP-forming)/AMP-acid ligase II